MKTALTIGALLLAVALSSLPADAASGDELSARLDRACATVVMPGAGASLADQAKAVDAYAAGVAVYQECLHGELRASRASLSQSQQALIAGRLSRSAYELTAARQDYANAVRAARANEQVAERAL